MDPFSITLGAISLAGATRKAIGGIKRLKALRDAPEELHDLLAELSQFEVVLQAIQDTAHPSESSDSPLKTLLGEAKDKIVEFGSLLEYRLTQAGSSSKVDRLGWIESRKDIDRLRKQLRDIRANLDVVIGVRTGTTVQQTLELMRQVHSENQELRQMATALVSLPQLLEEVQSTGSGVTGLLTNFPHLTVQSSRSDFQSVPEFAPDSVAQLLKNNASARSRDQLQLQRTYDAPHCRSNCPCECHRTSSSWSPWSLARLFGRAYLEKKGPSRLGASHHIQSCKASAVSQIRVIYFIPTWFAMKVVYIRYTSSPLHGPEWLIRIPRLVNEFSNEGFIAVELGSLPLFKSAIASGECTPYDINQYGRSLLCEIIEYWRYDMLVYLVRMGVDVLQPVDSHYNWLETLWCTFIGVMFPAGEMFPHGENFDTAEFLPLQALVPEFPWDEYKEEEEFTLLHEIVCHISGRDLDNAVQTHPADINRLDLRGRSPLMIAIHHQDIVAIRTLLRRGADPNTCNGKALCATLSTYSNKVLVIVELLLGSGATIYGSARDDVAAEWIQYSPLRTYYPDFLAIDKILIEHGIDVNHQCHRAQEQTLLMKLCEYGWLSSQDMTPIGRIEQLIGLGADLELRDSTERTALHFAIESNYSKATKFLVHAGACLDVKTNMGNTVAHLAVIFSMSIGFVKAISEIDLGRLDLGLKNEDGHTAYDLLRKRNGLKWEKHYEELCQRTDYYFHSGRFSHPGTEYQTILALEALLHHIQDSQGIPKDQQYPPLVEYLSDDKDENPVPGAWPL